VLSCFGVGTGLTAVGMIVAGTVALRSGVWSGWRRYTPFFLGVWMVAMMLWGSTNGGHVHVHA
jgi:hypothetical protein